MFVSTVGGGEGCGLTVNLPVRHNSSVATSPPTPSIYKNSKESAANVRTGFHAYSEFRLS